MPKFEEIAQKGTCDVCGKEADVEQTIRARLKIVNIPKRRLFFRHTLPIFLGIHQVFLRQIGFVWRKNLSLLGIFPIFKQRLEQKRLYFADSRSVPGQQKPSIL